MQSNPNQSPYVIHGNVAISSLMGYNGTQENASIFVLSPTVFAPEKQLFVDTLFGSSVLENVQIGMMSVFANESKSRLILQQQYSNIPENLSGGFPENFQSPKLIFDSDMSSLRIVPRWTDPDTLTNDTVRIDDPSIITNGTACTSIKIKTFLRAGLHTTKIYGYTGTNNQSQTGQSRPDSLDPNSQYASLLTCNGLEVSSCLTTNSESPNDVYYKTSIGSDHGNNARYLQIGRTITKPSVFVGDSICDIPLIGINTLFSSRTIYENENIQQNLVLPCSGQTDYLLFSSRSDLSNADTPGLCIAWTPNEGAPTSIIIPETQPLEIRRRDTTTNENVPQTQLLSIFGGVNDEIVFFRDLRMNNNIIFENPATSTIVGAIKIVSDGGGIQFSSYECPVGVHEHGFISGVGPLVTGQNTDYFDQQFRVGDIIFHSNVDASNNTSAIPDSNEMENTWNSWIESVHPSLTISTRNLDGPCFPYHTTTPSKPDTTYTSILLNDIQGIVMEAKVTNMIRLPPIMNPSPSSLYSVFGTSNAMYLNGAIVIGRTSNLQNSAYGSGNALSFGNVDYHALSNDPVKQIGYVNCGASQLIALLDNSFAPMFGSALPITTFTTNLIRPFQFGDSMDINYLGIKHISDDTTFVDLDAGCRSTCVIGSSSLASGTNLNGIRFALRNGVSDEVVDCFLMNPLTVTCTTPNFDVPGQIRCPEIQSSPYSGMLKIQNELFMFTNQESHIQVISLPNAPLLIEADISNSNANGFSGALLRMNSTNIRLGWQANLSLTQQPVSKSIFLDADNVIISGNLIVYQGQRTDIKTTDLRVEDAMIEVGVVEEGTEILEVSRNNTGIFTMGPDGNDGQGSSFPRKSILYKCAATSMPDEGRFHVSHALVVGGEFPPIHTIQGDDEDASTRNRPQSTLYCDRILPYTESDGSVSIPFIRGITETTFSIPFNTLQLSAFASSDIGPFTYAVGNVADVSLPSPAAIMILPHNCKLIQICLVVSNATGQEFEPNMNCDWQLQSVQRSSLNLQQISRIDIMDHSLSVVPSDTCAVNLESGYTMQTIDANGDVVDSVISGSSLAYVTYQIDCNTLIDKASQILFSIRFHSETGACQKVIVSGYLLFQRTLTSPPI